MSDSLSLPESYSARQWFGLVAGPLAFLALLALAPPEGAVAAKGALGAAAMRVAAVAALMACWWICEPVPVYATALIPLVAFPLLGIADMRVAAAPYANPTIFLFMGGFMIALAMQRWGLHRRMALGILSWTGTGPRQLVGGILAATVLMSMWINNTSTTLMMLPIAISILTLMRAGHADDGARRFETALVLAVAYGASIGGVATLIGTAPNALLAAFIQQTYGYTVSFAAWMMVGVPVSLVIAALLWVLLVRVLYPLSTVPIPGAVELLAAERAQLGPMSPGEKVVAVAFPTAALLWMAQPLLASAVPALKLSDAGIAMTVALALFVVPVDLKRGVFALDWEWANKLPWGLLVLFGGGLSLADAAGASGLAEWIGTGMTGWSAVPIWLLIVAFVVVIVFLSEIASNTAVAATLLPVLATAALAMGQSPLLFCIAGAMAASGGFMLPVATPPNAIAFGSGHVTAAQMVRAGFWLDLVWVLVVGLGVLVLLPLAFDVSYGVVPEWATKAKL
ncbi:MAG: DASS family sodium-coupled anion symporter [Rhodospirillaceae bacterium]|nr:DASS family sodium-coupled anion symporter [Rhodospirillaceae bacterium]